VIALDASALVELVLNTARGHIVSGYVQRSRGAVHAPSFVLIEVASAMRRLEQRREIDAARALMSLDGAQDLGVVMHDPSPWLHHVWALRHTLTSYDACYVALAEGLGVPLVTCDARLARSHGHTASIVLAGP